MSKAFREYATRVSFNVSLSRNQIYTLWVVSEQRMSSHQGVKDFGLHSDMFIPGVKWLEANGLVDYTPPPAKFMSHAYPWKLTEAGKHLVELVRIAGLIPQAITKEQAA